MIKKIQFTVTVDSKENEERLAEEIYSVLKSEIKGVESVTMKIPCGEKK